MYRDAVSSTLGGNACSLCAGDLIWDDEGGERVCTRCGAVSVGAVDDFLRVSQPSSSGTGSGQLRGTSPQEQFGANTVIGGVDVDGKGQRISQGRDLRQLRRLDTMVTWDSKKRRLRKVTLEIRRVAQQLGLSPVIAERGFDIYLREFEQTTKVKSLAAAAAASLCAACRELNVARPSNEIVAMSAGVNRKQLRHYYRILLGGETIREIPTPAKYVPSIAAKASLNGKTERRAIEILNEVKGNSRLVGKRPVPIAAAALYLASVSGGDRTTQLRLAYAAGVTPITIRKRCVELTEIIKTPH